MVEEEIKVYSKLVEDLKMTNQQIISENEGLREKFNKYNEDRNQMVKHKATLINEMSEVRKRIEHHTEENRELKNTLKAKANEILEMELFNEHYNSLEIHIEDLENKIKQGKNESEKLQEYEKELTLRLLERIRVDAFLQELLAEAAQQLCNLERHQEALMKEKESLKQKLQDTEVLANEGLIDEYDKSMILKGDDNTVQDDFVIELLALQCQLEESEEEILMENIKSEEKEEVIELILDMNEELKRNNKELKRELDSKQEELNAVQERLRLALVDMSRAKIEAKSVRKAIKNLKDNIKHNRVRSSCFAPIPDCGFFVNDQVGEYSIWKRWVEDQDYIDYNSSLRSIKPAKTRSILSLCNKSTYW